MNLVPKTANGFTALPVAARYGYVDVIKLLLDYGTIIDRGPPVVTCTPLHRAANVDPLKPKNYMTIMKYLLDNNADVNFQSANGRSALIAAAGNEQLLRLLLDKNANFNLKNGAGGTAMNYATRSGKRTVVALLEAKGVEPDAPIATAKTVVDALIGTWQGFQDGMPQALYTIVLNKAALLTSIGKSRRKY